VFSVQEKIDIVAQADPNKETCVAQAARVGTALSILNTIIQNRKETKKCYS
jgi:hypothetical protein